MAVALAAGGPAGADLPGWLAALEAATTVTAFNASRFTQLSCTVDRRGQVGCQSVLTQFLADGSLSADPAHFERHLSWSAASVNANPRSPAAPRTPTFLIGTNFLVSDLAASGAEPYLRIRVQAGGPILEVDSLGGGVVGARPSAVEAEPGLDGELSPVETGLDFRGERVLRVLDDAVRGLLLVSGSTRDARARVYPRAAGEFVLEVGPHPAAGRIVVTLTGVAFAGETPVTGTLAIDPASDLDPTIDATLCFARRAVAGTSQTAADLQCFAYPAGTPASLDLATLPNRFGVTFTSGFENGGTADWSGGSP